MSAKIHEPILHVKGWVNGRIQLRSRGCTPGFPANFESQVPCGPGNRTGRPVRYLLDAIHISRQNCTTNTCTNSSIIIYPYPSFVQRNLRAQPPPPNGRTGWSSRVQTQTRNSDQKAYYFEGKTETLAYNDRYLAVKKRIHTVNENAGNTHIA